MSADTPAIAPGAKNASIPGDARPERAKRFERALALDNRFLPPLLITCILLTAHLSFGILDARDYKAYDTGDTGRYFYNQGTGILEMTSGGGRGRKYRRNTDRSFVVVGDNSQDCTHKPGKDPRGSDW